MASTTCQIPATPGAGLSRESSRPLPADNSTSTKRERSQQPGTQAQDQRSRGLRGCLYCHICEDDPDSSSAADGSDSDDISCGDSEHSSPGAAQEYALPHDHRLQSSRPELLTFALESLGVWMKSTRYFLPPDDRLPPRKRLQASHWNEGDDNDDSIDGFAVVSPAIGYFHLACPFYVYNPAGYQQCLLNHDLRSIEDVICHLGRHHMKPPYCPLCSQTFDTLSSRDSHILERRCELRDPQHIQGINFYQKSQLKRRDKVYLGEAKRYQRIYATAFPNSDPPYSPYLDRGCGKATSMARDYWGVNGRLCVSQFLERSEILGKNERDRAAEDALCKLTLEDMLRVIIQRNGYQCEGFNS
ncbi:hypothetical protein BHE90_012747 [Fusarium euwallaceae]|uniref:C2H2-type domain-containing protein n=1 Tax=Fusarium euwallaceae TaxID=1147111 RepID=A0A430LAR4_9HYPO|nr:hypothetical protein BHE90_012747 [Fusarium euwallaceae]